MSTRFCDTAWAHIADLRSAILDLPLNRELAAGTLSRERFLTYMIQDSIYLVAFSRALALAAARAPDPEAVAIFAQSSQAALIAERSLHEDYFKRFSVSKKAVADARPNPSCHAYTSFLMATAHDSWEELVAAVLPCFWIYWDVGNRVAGRSVPGNPYQAWIDTYADPDFGAATDAVKAIADRAAADATPAVRQRMLRAFQISARYEWMFWDAAYRLEDWPLELR
ncbi:thiaminase II [Rhodothalassium salexigens]|uniref:TenA family protein n=1 Tax=Rhodothalassium salexigens TaxID=1086 RepID=UPI0019132C87|nr:TenA family protein [Rhodothalassium salexigens]MBK5910353.1 thiaminase II [Rhodothalassium salexigens]